jgi:hypothetical protein
MGDVIKQSENKEKNKLKIQPTWLFQNFQCQITNNFFKYQKFE